MTIQELIKKYPNDVELGEAVRKIFSNGGAFVNIDQSICSFSFEKPTIYAYSIEEKGIAKALMKEMNKSFSDNHKEEDFTIVSFLDNKGEHYIRNEKGTYNGGVGLCRNKLTLKYFKDNKIPVYSIKRNSDGVIFTIGDFVRFPTIKGYITAITENYIAINDVTTMIANVSHATPKARTFNEK